MAIGTIIKEYDWGTEYIQQSGMCALAEKCVIDNNNNILSYNLYKYKNATDDSIRCYKNIQADKDLFCHFFK